MHRHPWIVASEPGDRSVHLPAFRLVDICAIRRHFVLAFDQKIFAVGDRPENVWTRVLLFVRTITREAERSANIAQSALERVGLLAETEIAQEVVDCNSEIVE